jgi:serine/threonine-protein kinase
MSEQLEPPTSAFIPTSDPELDPGLAAAFGGQPSAPEALRQNPPGLRSVQLSEPDSAGASKVVLPTPAGLPTGEPGGARPRYQLLGEIARGGMGRVIKVRDNDLQRDVAVKVLLDRHVGKPGMNARFIEEAQITGQLQHPGVPPVHEVGILPDGRPFFVMKLIEGRTLADLLRERTQPGDNLPWFLARFEAVCQTLAYAHSRGVIHRDLKPQNVMVGAFGEVQVMDWGLAKVLIAEGPGEASEPGQPAGGAVATVRSESPDLASRTGIVLGTPAYMPPEQARGEVDLVDERADVFGLGAILCEILTGKSPHVGAVGEVHLQAVAGDLSGPWSRLDGCGADPELVRLAKACLAPDRDARPRDAGVVAGELTAYLASVQERARTAELERATAEAKVGRERQTRRMIGLLCAVLVLVLGAGVWVLRGQVQEGRKAIADSCQKAAIWTLQHQGVRKGIEPAIDCVTPPKKGISDEELQSHLQEFRADLHLLQSVVAILDRTAQPGRAQDYAKAFQEGGFDVEELNPEDWVRRLRARPHLVTEELLLALDDWALRVREVQPEQSGWRQLFEVARGLDSNSSRNFIREYLCRAKQLGRVDAQVLLRSAIDPRSLDPRFPPYRPREGMKFPNSITSVGSDTMRDLMWRWIVGFQDHHPGIKGEIDSPGSGEAADALLNGKAVVVPMSREMTTAEKERFRKTFGYEAKGVVIGFDGIAVYVHKDNPIQGMTLGQVKAVFSDAPRGGVARVRTWGDLGLKGEWADKPIRLYGRNPRSGTHHFFKERALGNGDYRREVETQPSSLAVVERVAGDRYAIGYSGIGYKGPGVRVVPLGKEDGGEKVEPASVTVSTREYPLSRPLYLYVNKHPDKPLDPLPAEFLRFVFSQEGQRVVLEVGEFPVTGNDAREGLKSVGLAP